MSAVLSYILETLAKELLVPLIKKLLTHIVDKQSKGIGITDVDFYEIDKLMRDSTYNSHKLDPQETGF